MSGLITAKDVLRHPWIIMRAWGPLALVHCLRAIVCRSPATFLAVAVATPRAYHFEHEASHD